MRIQKMYPMTGLQEGMAYHSQYEDKAEYVSQLVFDIDINTNLDNFGLAWEALVKEYDIFRTKFAFGKLNKNLQIVMDQVDFKVDNLGKRSKKDFTEICENERKLGFDLEQVPLMRVKVAYVENKLKVVWTHHHIILDGWSVGIIFEELKKIYTQLQNEEYKFSYHQKIQFEEYIKLLSTISVEQQKKYWEEYLDGISEPSLLGNGKNNQQYTMNEQRVFWDMGMYEKIDQFIRENQITTSSFFQAMWSYIMYRYTGKDEIMFGTTCSGRTLDVENIDKIPGLLINTIPCRIKISKEEEIFKWIKEVHNQELQSREYEMTPLSEIAKLYRFEDFSPLFDTLFVFENYPFREDDDSILKIAEIQGYEKANYPVVFSAGIIRNQGILFKIMYDSKQFTQLYVKNMFKMLRNITEEILKKSSEDKIGNLGRGLEGILSHVKGQEEVFPAKERLNECYDAVALEARHKVAIYDDGKSYTYEQIKQDYYNLANILDEIGIAEGDSVGLLSEKSAESIIIMLALSRIGAVCVPIDKNYPEERIKFMLQDSQVNYTIGNVTLDTISSNSINEENYIYYNEVIKKEVRSKEYNVQNLILHRIYTSGTTGMPKGVSVTHNNVISLVKGNSFIDVKKEDVFAHAASISFDASTFEIWTPLLNGGTLVVINGNSADICMWQENIEKYKINIAWLTSGLFNTFTEMDISIFSDFKYLLVGGEKLVPQYIKKAYSKLPNVQIINGYGPTETTTFATTYLIKRDEKGDIPIGKPQSNTELFVVGKNGEIMPIETFGELYIGGAGVTAGYHNRDELNREKFLELKYQNESQRVYKTGDIVKLRADGNMLFIGRNDDQIKIHGFRIELGEIENHVRSIEEIENAICLVKENKENGEKVIVLYYCGNVNETTLKKILKKSLPKYMVPQYIMQLSSFPLNENGKVDKRQLPEYKNNNVITEHRYVDEYETILINIWSDILQSKEISVRDNFFEIGGNSLLVVRLLNRVQKILKKKIEIREFYEKPTILDMKNIIVSEDIGEEKRYIIQGKKAEYELSTAQEQLWFLYKMKPNSTAYNMIAIKHLRENIDLCKFKKAYYGLINRHESLRTGFIEKDGKIYQYIQDIQPNLPFEFINLENEEDYTGKVRQLIKQYNEYKFVLEKDMLIKSALVKISNLHYIFISVQHHIISDGWSMDIFMDELMKLYNDVKLPVLFVQFKDYAAWEKEFIKSEKYKRKLTYWKQELSDDLLALNIPSDFSEKPETISNGKIKSVSLDGEVIEKIVNICKKEGVSFFTFMMAAYQSFLYRYTDSEEIVVGTPIANRGDSELENIIGYFVNTLPIRNCITKDDTFKEVLVKVRDKVLMAYNNQEVPFEKIVNEVVEVRDAKNLPIYQTVLTYQEGEVEEEDYELLREIHQTSKFNITLIVNKMKKGVNIDFEYDTDIYKHNTIDKFSKAFTRWIYNILLDIKAKCSHIPLLTDDEIVCQLNTWNATGVDCPYASFLEMFNEVSQKYPDKIAIYCENEEIDYKNLDAKSTYIATYIRNKEYNEKIIAVMMPRGIEFVITILGIMKAGCAYLPIDNATPKARVEYILEDADVNTICVTEKTSYYSDNVNRIQIAKVLSEKNNENNDGLFKEIRPETLAYVIYTSGTTGKPKGSLLLHQGLVNFCHEVAKKDFFDVNHESKVLQMASMAFDASVWEIFSSLSSGSTLCIYTEKDYAETLMDFIVNHQITHMMISPALYTNLDFSNVSNLKVIATGGSKYLYNSTIPKGIDIINAYGPTETTICVSYYKESENKRGDLPIGRAFGNIRLYVLGKNMQILPTGIPGELYIGGMCVGAGYINRRELTEEKFIQNPFSAETDILYKSGDLVKYLPDGNLQYIGRSDEQIKIRGFRIEPKEIEVQANGINGVLNSVIMVKTDKADNKHLVLFYTGEIDSGRVKEKLKELLPNYMIPTQIVKLKEFPLNTSGKIDIHKLKEIELKTEKKDKGTPGNWVEEKLLLIWKQVLGDKEIGIEDNFFDCGGDSILSIQIVSKAKQEGICLTTKDIFSYQTIKEQAAVATIFNWTQIAQIPIKGEVKLSPIQKWFFEKEFININHWNQCIALESHELINIHILQKAFQEVYLIHDILRSHYSYNGEGWMQTINESIDIKKLFEVIEIERDEISTVENLAQKSIQIEDNVLSKILIEKFPDNSLRIFWIIHHLLVDGVSWRILMEDLETIYLNLLSGKEEKTWKSHTYKDWTEGIEEYIAKIPVNTRKYWDVVVKTDKKLNKVLNDENTSIKGEIIISRIKIEEMALNYKASVQEILLSYFAEAFKGLFNQKNIWILLEGHGREEIKKEIDISRTVGWFTSLYPICLDLSKSNLDMLKNTKNILRNIPNNGFDYQFLCGEDSTFKEIAISFNYLGVLNEESHMDLWKVCESESIGIDPINIQKMPPLSITCIIVGEECKITIEGRDGIITDLWLQKTKNMFVKSIFEQLSNVDAFIIKDFKYTNMSEKLFLEIGKEEKIKEIFDVTALQEGMLFHSENTNSGNYISQWYCKIKGKIDVLVFNKAWRNVINSYDILRTNYKRLSDGEMRGFIKMPVKELDIKLLDWSEYSREEVEEKLEELLKNGQKTPFNVSRNLLMRFYLIFVADEEYIFIWESHHVLLDGWSMAIVINEVFKCYDSLLNGEEPNISSISFLTYIKWLKEQNLEEALRFWKKYLNGVNCVSLIETQGEDESEYVEEKWKCDSKQHDKMISFCQKNQFTISVFLQTAVGLALKELLGKNDIIYGTTTSGRNNEIEKIEKMVGLLINTIPIRFNFENERTGMELLKDNMRNQIYARQFEYAPLASIKRMAKLQGKTELFNVLYVHENYPVTNMEYTLKIEGVGGKEQTNYPFVLSSASGEELDFKLVYDRHAILSNTIEEFKIYLLFAIKYLLENTDEPMQANIHLCKAKLNQTKNVIEYERSEQKQESVGKQKVEQNYNIVFDGQMGKAAQIWREVLGRGCNYEDDFFEQGGDSLIAAKLLYRMKNEAGIEMSWNSFFENPCFSVFAGKKGEYCLEEYLEYDRKDASIFLENDNVLLTGLTGFLGIHLLGKLLSQGYNVWGIVRASSDGDAMQRVERMAAKYKVNLMERKGSLKVYAGDISEINLGLEADRYLELCNTISKIYNCAANVNFMASFKDAVKANVIGVKNIIEFAETIYLKEIHHVSTLAVLCSEENLVFSEKAVLENFDKLKISYDKTKWMAEKLLEKAKTNRNRISIYRLGRLSGSSQSGICPKGDLLWLVVRTVIMTGRYPDVFSGAVEINPVDITAEMILDLSRRYEDQIFHLYNPKETSFEEILDILNPKYHLKKIPYADWIRMLETEDGHPLKGILPLLSTGILGMQNVRYSNDITLNKLDPLTMPVISEELLKKYIESII